jgi:hypothetical protein
MRVKSLVRAFLRTKKFKTITLITRKKLSNFCIEKSIYNTNYSLETTWCRFDVSPELLRVYIHGLGFVPIEDSPHYIHLLSLTNNINDDAYKNYLHDYYPNEDEDKSISSFNLLFTELSRNMNSDYILVELPTANNDYFNVVDGTHRLAIFTILGLHKIKCRGKL